MTDEFETILNQCLDDIAAGRATIDACVKRYSQFADELTPPLDIAAQTRALPSAPAVAPEARRAMRQKILDRASQLNTRSAFQQPGRAKRLHVGRRLPALVILVSMVVIVASTTVALAASSVPGDTLYPIKRATEQVTLSLTPMQRRAAFHVQLGDRRLQEFAILDARGSIHVELLDEASHATQLALDELAVLPMDQQGSVLQSIVQVSEKHVRLASDAAAAAPADLRPSLEAAAAPAALQRTWALGLLTNIRSSAPATRVPYGSVDRLTPTTESTWQPPSGGPTAVPTVHGNANSLGLSGMVPGQGNPNSAHTPQGNNGNNNPPGQGGNNNPPGQGGNNGPLGLGGGHKE